MALTIASVPVLTGEVAKDFEQQAQNTYERYLEREDSPKSPNSTYSQGVQMVRDILSKSKLGVA